MSNNIIKHSHSVSKEKRAKIKSQKPCILWFSGLSGSGKSTIANRVEQKLNAMHKHTYLLDGDNIRLGLNKDLGFSDSDREENIRRIAEVAKLFVDSGLITLTAFISPFRKDREFARGLVEEGEFVEIFVDAPLEVCKKRDPKGLYKKAQEAKIENFTGISSVYEKPLNPEIILKTDIISIDESVEKVVDYLKEKGCV